jgi:phthalate 4,5-cis-dihydrodiol dehydrogenase
MSALSSKKFDSHTVGLGVCGLGRAFTLMLPTFLGDTRFRLVAATTPNAKTREMFSADFEAQAYESLETLCNDPAVDAVYISSPHEFHRQHAEIAARAGKHILVEKPMAISVSESVAIVKAVADTGVHLVVGPSHSFDAPVVLARTLIESGEFGPVGMIQAMYYTDFLYRPRRPAELDSNLGGGVVFSQAAHQADIVRLLGGGNVKSVRAHTANWDKNRSTEGAYTAQLLFESGAFASMTYSGYAHFDGDELCGWAGELGHNKDPANYGTARKSLADSDGADAESEAKRARNYGLSGSVKDFANSPPHDANEHFGQIIVSCPQADLKLQPDGVMIYGNNDRRHVKLPTPKIPRLAVMDELYDAVVHNRPPLHSAAWGLATLEVCAAILTSAREQREIELIHQFSI